MMTCRDVSTTVASDQVKRRSMPARMQIWMHLLVCPHCRRFWRQLRAIDRGVIAWLGTVESEAPADLEGRVARRLTAAPETDESSPRL